MATIKAKWSPILESEDENGNITSYATKMEGKMFFISQQPDGLWAIEDWNVNILRAGFKSFSSAKRFFARCKRMAERDW